MQRYTRGQQTHTLTQSQAKSLHISSDSLHSAEKRLKCHKCSCSRRGQWQLLKLLLLPSLLPAPYHSPSLHISLTLLTLFLSFFLTSSLLSCLSLSFSFAHSLPPPLLSDLSFPPVQRLHNAHQLFRGSLPVSPAYPIRAGLRTNGLLLYLLPAPTHSRDSAGEGGREGGREIDRGNRGDSQRGGRMRRRDKDSEPTRTNRSRDREGKIFQCFSPQLWGAVIDVLSLVCLALHCPGSLSCETVHTETHIHTCIIQRCDCHLSRRAKKKKKQKKKSLQAQAANLHKGVELNMLCRLAGSQCMKEEVGERIKYTM